MTYQEAIDWLFRQLPMFSRVGAAAYKPGLQTSENLDRFFDHPHRKFKSIHVAGTNGKGSCSHTIAATLQAAGYKTGLYTSPHLVDFRERIRVDGAKIPEEAVVDFVERFRKSGYEGKPSFFELTMMMAFDWFARAGVDYAVIEVGMGGRLDSTNIISPIGCVITNISFDHTQFLGTELSQIASEKAGIIKQGIPVVIGETTDETRPVFIEKAQTVGAPISFAEEEKLLDEAAETESGYNCHSPLVGDFHTSLAGEYQLKNIPTILSAIKMLRSAGIEIPDQAIAQGFANVEKLTGLAGRWMHLQYNPEAICDTGHNQAGITYNIHRLKQLMLRRPKDAKLRIVLGFVADKDVDHILRLFPTDAIYYVTNAAIPRALPVEQLLEKCHACGLNARSYTDVPTAYEAALSEAKNDDLIYVGGSTFIVADLLASFPEKR